MWFKEEFFSFSNNKIIKLLCKKEGLDIGFSELITLTPEQLNILKDKYKTSVASLKK